MDEIPKEIIRKEQEFKNNVFEKVSKSGTVFRKILLPALVLSFAVGLIYAVILHSLGMGEPPKIVGWGMDVLMIMYFFSYIVIFTADSLSSNVVKYNIEQKEPESMITDNVAWTIKHMEHSVRVHSKMIVVLLYLTWIFFISKWLNISYLEISIAVVLDAIFVYIVFRKYIATLKLLSGLKKLRARINLFQLKKQKS